MISITVINVFCAIISDTTDVSFTKGLDYISGPVVSLLSHIPMIKLLILS